MIAVPMKHDGWQSLMQARNMEWLLAVELLWLHYACMSSGH